MKKSLSVVLVTLALVSCKPEGSQEKQAGYVRVASVPVIQQELLSNTPLFQGKPNNTIMEQVCNYVAGVTSKEDFNAFFQSRNIDPAKLASQDAGFKFLADQDINNYARGCAAFITAKIFSPAVFYSSEKLSPQDAANDNNLKSRLNQLRPTAEYVAQYIAQLASNSADKQYDSLQTFKSDTRKSIGDTAKAFVTKVISSRVDESQYEALQQHGGYSFSIAPDNISLYLNGSQWLGNGYAMGVKYVIDVKA